MCVYLNLELQGNQVNFFHPAGVFFQKSTNLKLGEMLIFSVWSIIVLKSRLLASSLSTGRTRDVEALQVNISKNTKRKLFEPCDANEKLCFFHSLCSCVC